MKKFFLVYLLIIVSVFASFTPNALAISEETENCIDRVAGKALKRSNIINIDQYLNEEIKNFCLKANLDLPYSQRSEMAQASQDMVEDFFSYVVLLKDVADDFSAKLLSASKDSILYEKILAKNSLFSTGENNLIKLKNDSLDTMRKYSQKYTYIESDIQNIESEFSAYMTYSKNVLGAWDDNFACQDEGYKSFLNDKCRCFIGYEWDSQKVKCSLMTTSVQPSSTSTKQASPVSNATNLSPTATTIVSDQFTADVGQSQFKDAIIALKNKSIISGYDDGTFKPFNPINRAEFMKIVVGATGMTPAGRNCFSDVHDEWFASFICVGMANGIVGGYKDGTFRPGQNINVAEALKIVLKAFSITTREAKNGEEWFIPFIEYAEKNNFYLSTFSNNNRQLTREDMAELIYRIMPKQ